MSTYPDEYKDFLLTDDEYVARTSRKLAGDATLRFRHRNRGPIDNEDFEDFKDDLDEDEDYDYFEDDDESKW
jgi:hypothetical protein